MNEESLNSTNQGISSVDLLRVGGTTLYTLFNNGALKFLSKYNKEQERLRNISNKILDILPLSYKENKWSFILVEAFPIVNKGYADSFSFPYFIILDYSYTQKLSDNQLAFVVAHELAHAILWHYYIEYLVNKDMAEIKINRDEILKEISYVVATSVPVGILTIPSTIAITALKYIATSASDMIIENLSKNISMDFEKIADETAIQFITKAGYDETEVLNYINQRGYSLTNIHPLNDQRGIIIKLWVNNAKLYEPTELIAPIR